MSTRRIYIMMIFTALFWSGAFITGKIAVQQFPPFALTFFRFLFALPFIFFILYKKQPTNWYPARNQWVPIIILGVVGTFLYHGLFFSSIQYTSPTNASLIGATNPMVTTLMALLFLGEGITSRRVLGIVLSFSGVFLVITKGSWEIISNFSFNIGDILMFIAVCSWAGYSVLSRKYMKQYQITPLVLTAYTFLVCTITTVPFVIWESPSTYIFKTTMGGWAAILYMAVFASVLGYLFQLIAIQQIGAPKSAMFNNLVPVFTILLSVLILGETISWFKLLCCGIIIGGVYLTTKPEVRLQKTICKQELIVGQASFFSLLVLSEKWTRVLNLCNEIMKTYRK